MNFSKIASVVVLALATLSGCAAESSGSDTTSPPSENAVHVAQPIVVTAIAQVKPGTEAEFEAAALKLVKATHDEPGNLGDVLTRSKSDPSTFLFYERWASEQASQDHLKAAAVTEFFGAVKADFQPGFPQLTTYETLAQ